MPSRAPNGNEPASCPPCPICEGTMQLVYDRFNQQVCVCVDCHSGLTIPSSAWEVIRLKREKKWGVGKE
jgi:hypothetical protein